MPRRRLEKPADKRDAKAIAFRVNAAEREAIEQRAAAAKMDVGAFARKAALGARITVKQTRQLSAKVMTELHRQGVNLNQLVRLANEGRLDPALAEEARAVLAQIADVMTTWGEDDAEGEE